MFIPEEEKLAYLDIPQTLVALNFDTSGGGVEPSSDGGFRGRYNNLINHPLLGGGRSCACIASYKCGEGVYPVRENLVPLQMEGLGVVQPVRETQCHPELDSVSIQYGQADINRFRVEHGMRRVKTLSVVLRRHLSVGEIEDNLTTPFIPLPKGDNQELGGVAC